jgi:coenzyme F420-0:L-glutamate ligase/coenzyme F420-1:gamma-L-glutamate ligase
MKGLPLMPTGGIRIWGVQGIPEIEPGTDLAGVILASLAKTEVSTEGSIILVIAQKVVSKAEGRIVRLDEVVPSPQARSWAEKYHRDARMIEIVFRQARRIVRMDRGVIIAETAHGFVCANAGVDASNAPAGTVILLPADPDRSAEELRRRLANGLGRDVGVIVSDTFGRPWRTGLTNVALGVAGISAATDYRGQVDSFGRILQATVLATADELAAAAELVMGKTARMPVAVIEGYPCAAAAGSGRNLIRPAEDDLFR